MRTETDKKEVIKQQKHDKFYLDIALRVSEMSDAIRNKVGCVIVKNHNIISYGWNGMPKGFDNNCEDEVNGKLITKKEVLHSELNAISKLVKSNQSSENSTLYLTLSPCLECSKLIIQSSITRVVYINEYRKTDGLELLKKAGINVERMFSE